MPIPSFANHTVTVVSPGTKKVQNSPVDDWSAAAVKTRDLTRSQVQPSTTEESETDPDTIRAGYRILTQPNQAPPTPKDRIRHPLAAGDYAVIGEVMAVPRASGGIDHYAFYVERWGTRG